MSSINNRVASSELESGWRSVARARLAGLSLACLALLAACGGSESDPPASATNTGRAQALAVPNPNAVSITGVIGYGTNRFSDGLYGVGAGISAYPINDGGYVAINRTYPPDNNGTPGLNAFELTRDGVTYELVPAGGGGAQPDALAREGQAINNLNAVTSQLFLGAQPVSTYGLFTSRYQAPDWVFGPYSPPCECYFRQVFVNANGVGVALAVSAPDFVSKQVFRIGANGVRAQLSIDPRYLTSEGLDKPKILADGTIYVGVLNYDAVPQAYEIWRFAPDEVQIHTAPYSLPVTQGAIFSWDVNEQGVLAVGESGAGGSSAVIRRVVNGVATDVPGTLVNNSGAIYPSTFINSAGLIAAHLIDQSIGFGYQELIYARPGHAAVRVLAKDDLLGGARVSSISPTSNMNESGQLTIYTSLDLSPEPNPARNRVSIVTPLFPTIAALSPTSGPIGTAVTITGTRLATATAVTFNGLAAAFTVNSDTQLTATVPTGASSGPVTVTTPAGSVDSSAFTVTAQAAPTITGLVPTLGRVGDRVTITGTNLQGATDLRFNGVSASFSVRNATSITARVPVGAASGPVTVVTPGGSASSAGNFVVAYAPTITGFSPGFGPRGSTVTVTGSGFVGVSRVLFDGRMATFTVINESTITAVVPARSGTGPITVNALGGRVTTASSFAVTP